MAQSAEEYFFSDEIPEMFCERCDLERKYATAEGLCVICEDYMCQVCIKYHCQYKPDHEVLAKSEMPTDVCFDRCSHHTGKLIKFYCECCSSFACSDCRQAALECDNREDHHWRHLPLLLVDFDNSNVQEAFEKSLCEVKQKLDIMHKNAERMKTLNDKCFNTATQKLEQKILTYSSGLSIIEQDFRSRIEREKSLNDTNVQVITNADETFKSEIDSIENDLEKMRDLGPKANLFISAVSHQKHLKEINCKLDILNSKSDIDTYSFEPENKEMASEDIGTFSVDPKEKNININTNRAFTIKTGLKRFFLVQGGINGMCLVKGIFLIIVSDFCKSIKVFHVERFPIRELFSYSQSTEPHAVTTLNENQIAVSLYNSNKGLIYIFRVSDEGALIKCSEIYIQTGCLDLTEYETGLIAVHESPIRYVNVMLTTGKIVKTIEKDSAGKALFRSPAGVALSLDKKNMYVSEVWNNAVIALNMNGEILGIYQDDHLKHPRGLTVDDDGLLYVCGEQSNNIHILTPSFHRISIIQMVSRPISVLYDSLKKLLYVGLETESKIIVFEVHKAPDQNTSEEVVLYNR